MNIADLHQTQTFEVVVQIRNRNIHLPDAERCALDERSETDEREGRSHRRSACRA